MNRSTPSFTVVVPTYDRPEQLRECVRAISALDYPHDRFEVIVVDDGGTENLSDVAAQTDDGVQISLLRQAKAGPAAARNTGAGRAKHEFLVFTDDDCAPAPDYLRKLARRFAESPDCAIGGRTHTALLDLYSVASQLLIDYLYEYYNADPSRARFLTSNNLAMPTDRFHQLGGFDTRFRIAAAEDRDLCERWLEYGYRLIHAPEAVVYHSHAMTFRQFCRQHFNYGSGAVDFHRARVKRTKERIRIEPPSFYLNLVRYPFQEGRDDGAVRLAVLLLVSQAANAAGFFKSRFGSSLARQANAGSEQDVNTESPLGDHARATSLSASSVDEGGF